MPCYEKLVSASVPSVEICSDSGVFPDGGSDIKPRKRQLFASQHAQKNRCQTVDRHANAFPPAQIGPLSVQSVWEFAIFEFFKIYKYTRCMHLSGISSIVNFLFKNYYHLHVFEAYKCSLGPLLMFKKRHDTLFLHKHHAV